MCSSSDSYTQEPSADCTSTGGPVSTAPDAVIKVTSQIINASTFALRSDLPAPDAVELSVVSCVAKALVLAIENPKQTAHGNEQIAPGIFDSSVVPNISVDRYLQRLKSVFDCSDEVFILAVILVDRLLEKEGLQPEKVTMRKVHRLFLGSLVVTVKYNQDLVYGNSHYARAGGMHVKEVNRLERFILRGLDYDLHVHPEQYYHYERTLRVLRLQPASTAPQALSSPKAGYAKAGCASAVASAAMAKAPADSRVRETFGVVST